MYKKKMIVFPYHEKLIPLYMHQDMIRDYEMAYLVSPEGYSITGKEGSIYFDNLVPNVLYVKNHISSDMIEKCEAIWLTDQVEMFDDKELEDIVRLFCQQKNNKDVIITAQLKDNILKKIIHICDNYNANLLLRDNLREKSSLILDRSIESTWIKDINTPIVMIMSSMPNSQKLDIQLYLRKYFLEYGYKVSQIGTGLACELLGFYSNPEFLNDNMRESDKILMFNNFVKEIELRETPDIIIIGVAGAIIPLSDKHNFSFGITAYEVCNAVHSDFTILSLPNGEYNDGFYNEMSTLCLYRYNTKIDSFFISDNSPISNSFNDSRLTFSFQHAEKDYKDGITFDSNNLKTDTFAKTVISKLEKYADYESF